MSELYSGKKIIRALEKLEFSVISTKGSHIKMRGLRNNQIQTVIIPMHKEVAIGTMKSILKQASVSLEELHKNI